MGIHGPFHSTDLRLGLRRKPLLEFYKALEEWPEAERLWVYTCMQMREHRALEALFRHTSRHERLAALTAREAQQQGDDVAAKERLLKLAAEHFRPVDPVAQKLTQDEIGTRASLFAAVHRGDALPMQVSSYSNAIWKPTAHTSSSVSPSQTRSAR